MIRCTRKHRIRSMVSWRRRWLSQNGRHGCLCNNVVRGSLGGSITRRSLLVFGNNSFEFLFGKIKNLCRQRLVRIDVSIQRWIPNIGTHILVVVMVVRFQFDGSRFLAGCLAAFFRLAGSLFFSVPLFSFDVSVSLANELGQDHVKSLVPSPGPCQVPKGSSRNARQYQDFHPDQFSFPALQLGGRIVNRKHATGSSLFVAMPRRGLECIKAVL